MLAVIIAAVGYFPTMRLGGSSAVTAMLVGCLISLIASVAGAVPVARASCGPVQNLPQVALLSTTLRFLVVLMLALAAALSGWFDTAPLLVWVAISYLVLLAADTVYVVRLSSEAATQEK